MGEKTIKNIPVGLVLLTVCFTASIVRSADSFSDDQLSFFETRIRPVFIEHCYECHSQEAKQTKGGLQLDHRAAVLRGGDSGPAIVPGQPDQSLVIQAVRHESLEMPPQGKLPAGVIADLVKWIEMGAPDPRVGDALVEPVASSQTGDQHWAFQPVREFQRPPVRDVSWPTEELDFFVLNRLEQEGLSPSSDADRYTWLRRVSFDLTGLPPTVSEIREFLGDPSESAFQRVVDRLLSSRAFGECWARHWLDLVGYADQIGTSNDIFAEHAWRYRDYVIDALNSDKPFDRFVREQIAGDLLPYEALAERVTNLTAVGFLVLGDLEIVEADKAKLRVDAIDQQVVKTSKAFLGMTLGCARCHDHKFDPISQDDYYAIGGFFNGVDSVYETGQGVWSDVIANELPESETQVLERERRAQLHEERIVALKDERDQATARKTQIDESLKNKKEKVPTSEELTKERDQLAGRIGKLNQEIAHAEFFKPSIPKVYGVQEVEKPANMRITIRANPRALGEEVSRGFLQTVSAEVPKIPAGSSGRRQLADWIASRENPLTARVTVNRIWQKLFGAGLVKSVDYFGVRGDLPSHPELLDHLAFRFMTDGWSQKEVIRSLVLSRTYRMSSRHDDHGQEVDLANRWLWRMNRRRLDAESLRDGLLAVSGRLQASSGGPSLPLEFPENVANINPKNVNPPSFRLDKWRPEHEFQRTIYLPIIRSAPQRGPGVLLNVFDFAQPAEFVGQRSVTAVPTQALFLMNSPIVKKHASNLAARIQAGGVQEVERLELLWMCTLNRPITNQEKQDAEAFLAQAGESGWTELCHAVIASNEFLMRL